MRTVPSARTAAPVGAVARTAPAAERDGTAAAAESLGGLTRALAAAPPVDTDRVAAIKAAVAGGTYSIEPTTIADRLIAFKQQWDPSDAS